MESSTSIQNPIIPFARVSPVQIIIAALLVILVTLARFLPWIPVPEEQYLGGIEGDNGLYVWLFRYHVHHLFSAPWFETNGFYPYVGTLAWSDNFILPGALGYLLVWCGLSEPLAYNVIILSAYAASGFFIWLSVTRISGATSAGMISAVAWLSWCYWGLQVGHPQLLFHVFLTAGLYLFLCALHRPSVVTGALASLLVIGAFATTAYYAIFLVMMWAVLSFGILVVKPWAILRRANFRTLLGGAILSPLLAPFLMPYFKTIQLFGERGLYESHYFSANARSWLGVPDNSLIFGFLSRWGTGEAFLFPGFIVIALAVLSAGRISRSKGLRVALCGLVATFTAVSVLSIASLSAPSPYEYRLMTAVGCWSLLLASIGLGFVLRKVESKRGFVGVTHRSLLFAIILLAVVFWTLTLGPLGNPEKGQLALGPWAAVHSVVPGASAIRAVSRCAIVCVLALCTLAGLGVGLKLPSSQYLVFLVPFLIIGIWVEGSMRLQPSQALPPVPEALREFVASSERAVIIALPFTDTLDQKGAPASWTDFASRQALFLNWLTGSPHVAINGYSGQQTKIMRELPRAVRSFPSEPGLVSLCKFPELSRIFVSAELVLPHPLPDGLSILAKDTAGNKLLSLDCSKLPFLERELIVPPETRTISCYADGTESLRLDPASSTEWQLEFKEKTITISQRYKSGRLHLTRIKLSASSQARIGSCVLQYESKTL